MKFLLRRAALLICLFAAAALPLSAQPATGAVQGRVQESATGNAIPNARVLIQGTNRFTTTDEGGHYYVPNLPAGNVTVMVSAASMEPQSATVAVAGGETAVQNFGLTNVSMSGQNVVKLNEFVVASTRETNSAAIAINEQRTMPNITSVVSADEFGTRIDQNPGEFLKMLPGVDVTYFANNIVGVSVHGLPSDATEIQFDGLRMASFNSEGVSRGMEVQYQSAADASRVEIHKLPIPEDDANTIGGTINFVRKSAFEYDRPKVEYSGEFISDGEHLTLGDMQGVMDRRLPRWKPNWTVSVTDPVTKNFGVSVTLGQNQEDVGTHWSLPGWNLGSSAENAAAIAARAAGQPVANVPSIYNPSMRNPLSHDAPKLQGKNFGAARFDWRPIDPLTLNFTVGGTKGWVENADDVRFTWDNHATGSGDVTRYNDPHNALGQPGDGAIYFNAPLWRDVDSPTDYVELAALWRKGDWEFSEKIGLSESKYSYHDTEDGFFANPDVSNVTGLVNVPLTGVGFGTGNPVELTVDYHDIDYWGAKTVNAYTTPRGASGVYPSGSPNFFSNVATTGIDSNLADYTVPVNWQSNSSMGLGGVRSRPARGKEILGQTRTYLKRYFDFANPLSVQIGFDWSSDFRERTYPYYTWRFVGPNNSVSQISAVSLVGGKDWQYGLPGPQRISMSRYFALYKAHPEWFQYDGARSDMLSQTSNPAYKVWEKIPAPYAEFNWHLLDNRLTIAGGVRYEKVINDASGELTNTDAAYSRYANGQIVRVGDKDAAGNLTYTGLGTGSFALTSPNIVPAPSTATPGQPIFLPSIQAAGAAQAAAYSNPQLNLLNNPNYTGGFTTDTGANLGRASQAYSALVYHANGAKAKGHNQGYFPSVNLAYNITENLNFQVGYARTEARLDISKVLVPGSSVSDTAPTSGPALGAPGVITVNNPNLKPWTADNVDARLTWYNQNGGYIGVGGFAKWVKNAFVTQTSILSASDIATLAPQFPELNLSPSEVGYGLTYQYNAGNAEEEGVEVEVRQNLDAFIGRWVRGFRIYATSTYQHPKQTLPIGSGGIFTNIHWHDKVGLAYAFRRFQANINLQHYGIQNDQSISNTSLPVPVGQQYELAYNILDVQAGFQVARWAQILVGANDILDAVRAREQRYPFTGGLGSMTSSNSYGKTYYIGIRGEF